MTHTQANIWDVIKRTGFTTCIIILISTTPAWAVSYNYHAVGIDFDINGMFDCPAPLAACNPSNVSNYSLTVRRGILEGFTLSEGPNTIPFEWNPISNRLALIHDGIERIDIIAGFMTAKDARGANVVTRFIFGETTVKPIGTIPVPSTILLLSWVPLFLAGYGWYQARRHWRLRGIVNYPKIGH